MQRAVEWKLFEVCSDLIGEDVDEEKMEEARKWLQRRHFLEVAEERCVSGLCGWLLCRRQINQINSSKQRYRMDNKAKRLYEVDESVSYCSTTCLESAVIFQSSLDDSAPASRSIAKTLPITQPEGDIDRVLNILNPTSPPSAPNKSSPSEKSRDSKSDSKDSSHTLSEREREEEEKIPPPVYSNPALSASGDVLEPKNLPWINAKKQFKPKQPPSSQPISSSPSSSSSSSLPPTSSPSSSSTASPAHSLLTNTKASMSTPISSTATARKSKTPPSPLLSSPSSNVSTLPISPSASTIPSPTSTAVPDKETDEAKEPSPVLAPAPPISIVSDGASQTIAVNMIDQNTNEKGVESVFSRVSANSEGVSLCAGSQKYLAQIQATKQNNLILESMGSKSSSATANNKKMEGSVQEWMKDRPPIHMKPGRSKQVSWVNPGSIVDSSQGTGTRNEQDEHKKKQSQDAQSLPRTLSSSGKKLSTVKRISTPGLITPKYLDRTHSSQLLADFANANQANDTADDDNNNAADGQLEGNEARGRDFARSKSKSQLEDKGVDDSYEDDDMDNDDEDDDNDDNEDVQSVQIEKLDESSIFSESTEAITSPQQQHQQLEPIELPTKQEIKESPLSKKTSPLTKIQPSSGSRHFLDSSILKGDVMEKTHLKPLPDVSKRFETTDQQGGNDKDASEAALLIEGYLSEYKGIRVASSTLMKEMSFNPFEGRKDHKLTDYDKEVLKEIYGSNYKEEGDKVILDSSNEDEAMRMLAQAPTTQQPSLFMTIWLTLDDLFEDGKVFKERGEQISSSSVNHNESKTGEMKSDTERRGTLDTATQHAKNLCHDFLLRGLSAAEAAVSLNTFLGREELQLYASEKQRLLASKATLITCPALTTSQWSFLGLILVDALIRHHIFTREKDTQKATTRREKLDQTVQTVATKFIQLTSDELKKLRTFFF